jgi:hypothetical protein
MSLLRDLNHQATVQTLPLREQIEEIHAAGEGVFNNPYRMLSEAFFKFIDESRLLHEAGVVEFSEDDAEILESDLGQWAEFEGRLVPLDCPMEIDHILEDDDQKHIEEERKYFEIGIDCLDGLLKYVRKEDDDASAEHKKDYKEIAEQADVLKKMMKDHIESYDVISERASPSKEKKPLRKPMRGGPKKFKVYVRNPKTGNIKQVNFGAKDGGGNLAVKLDDPEAKRNFAKRHDCKNANDPLTPSYWSCRLPRYAKQLGLSAKGGGWW